MREKEKNWKDAKRLTKGKRWWGECIICAFVIRSAWVLKGNSNSKQLDYIVAARGQDE